MFMSIFCRCEVVVEGYIRKREDFSISIINILSYDVVLSSISESISTIVATSAGDVFQGDFILCDEFCGVVKQVAVTGRTMTLTCSDIDSIFSRPLYFAPDTDTSSLTMESFFLQELVRHYKTCDEMYAYSYLAFNTAGALVTPFFRPQLSDKNMYSLGEYIKAARRRGVAIDYDLAGERLGVIFGGISTVLHKLDFTSNNAVTSETYGGYSVAKVTNYVDGSTNDYYLLSDGTITQDAGDSRRVYGAWEVMTDASEDAILQKLAVTYGHEIIFSDTKRLPFLALLRVKLSSGRIVESFISSVRKKSGSNKYDYTAGELKTTLTAKLRR